METESCSESEASLTAGDIEVAASAAPGPISPCRTRSMGKARSPKPLKDRDGQAERGQSAPSPGPSSPLAMALSPEGPDTRLLHSHREVWEDQLQWEEVRSMKRKEVAPREPTPPPVPEPQGALQSGGTPPPSSVARETASQEPTPSASARVPLSQMAPMVNMSPYREFRCPDWVWELAAGLPLQECAVPLRFMSRGLSCCRFCVPLSVKELKEMFSLIRRGKITFKPEDVQFHPWK